MTLSCLVSEMENTDVHVLFTFEVKKKTKKTAEEILVSEKNIYE